MRLPEKAAHCCAPDRSFQEEMGVVVHDAVACGLVVEAGKMGGLHV
jgi:hypothetical protein